jgi:hypothetical protein
LILSAKWSSESSVSSSNITGCMLGENGKWHKETPVHPVVVICFRSAFTKM